MHNEPSFDAPSDESLLADLRCGSEKNPARMVVSGEMDEVSAVQLQRAVVDVLRQHRPSCIEMDLQGVTFLDSAGIKALLVCHADGQQVGCRLQVIRPRRNVYRVLEITGLLEYLGVTNPPPAAGPRLGTGGASPDSLHIELSA
jgi:anti-anti-sigma factor